MNSLQRLKTRCSEFYKSVRSSVLTWRWNNTKAQHCLYTIILLQAKGSRQNKFQLKNPKYFSVKCSKNRPVFCKGVFHSVQLHANNTTLCKAEFSTEIISFIVCFSLQWFHCRTVRPKHCKIKARTFYGEVLYYICTIFSWSAGGAFSNWKLELFK